MRGWREHTSRCVRCIRCTRSLWRVWSIRGLRCVESGWGLGTVSTCPCGRSSRRRRSLTGSHYFTFASGTLLDCQCDLEALFLVTVGGRFRSLPRVLVLRVLIPHGRYPHTSPVELSLVSFKEGSWGGDISLVLALLPLPLPFPFPLPSPASFLLYVRCFLRGGAGTSSDTSDNSSSSRMLSGSIFLFLTREARVLLSGELCDDTHISGM